ncbi:MAG: ABC transporter substrate-binding protein [Spirochaetaceae bacterium]|jgi:NitT/TauT family transport system substrate-binding protein|nr:ABC transporter substrate-binding protein [Spirochaetaceae bacterium]
MKKKLILTAVIAVFCFTACKKKAGTESGSPPSRRPQFDIAYSGITCGAPVAVAALKGFYAEEGVDVELVSGTAFEAQQAALASGKMPVINGDFQFFPAIQNGFDIKIISGLHEGCIKVLVPNDSPIQKISDLKGKTVLVDGIGGTPMMVTAVAAGRAGLKAGIDGDIIWKPFPWDQLLQAMEKGEGDAVAVWDPFATQGERSGKYRTLIDIGKDEPFAGKNCCFMFASGKLIREEPESIAAVLRAIQKAIAWTGSHPEETAALLISSKKIASDDTEFISALIESYKYHNYHGSHSIIKAKEDALFFARELITIGYLPADLDAQKFIDETFVAIN